MVYFVCGACQETVKKPKVDAHAMSCRGCWALSCVDCGKTFEGEAFRAHNSCISEAELYQGALYQAPSSGSKPKKQDGWMEFVQSAAESGKVPPRLKTALAHAASMDNVPRKVKPFMNYIRNSFRGLSEADATELFNFIQTFVVKPAAPAPAPAPAPAAVPAAGAPSADTESTTATKRKREDDNTTPASVVEDEKTQFDWDEQVKTALTESKKGKLSLRKLQARVLDAAHTAGLSDEQILAALFHSKVAAMASVTINDDDVKLK